MELTTQQQRAKNLIIDFIKQKEENNFYLLKGYAGTGKTTTINNIIAEYQSNNYNWIASVAPTHKAVQVLRKKGAEANCHNIDYTTLHQLLGLTSEIDYETGSQIFTQVDKNNIKKYDLIIIDECSMIDNEIWNITNHNYYEVYYDGHNYHCTCEDFLKINNCGIDKILPCKHCLAVQAFVNNQQQSIISI